MVDAVVADANPILSALLGGSARDVLFCGKMTFFSPPALSELSLYLCGELQQAFGQLQDFSR
jgi:hypothetical protein